MLYKGKPTQETGLMFCGGSDWSTPQHSYHFYHKLREVIAEKIAEDVPFDGEIKGDESNFGAGSVGRLARCQCLACSSGGERFIPKSLRMPLRP